MVAPQLQVGVRVPPHPRPTPAIQAPPRARPYDPVRRWLTGTSASTVREGGGGRGGRRLRRSLSDVDKNGKLDPEEFTVAMYLAKLAADGEVVPSPLPANLGPPTHR